LLLAGAAHTADLWVTADVLARCLRPILHCFSHAFSYGFYFFLIVLLCLFLLQISAVLPDLAGIGGTEEGAGLGDFVHSSKVFLGDCHMTY
jgi:hypothetical protein